MSFPGFNLISFNQLAFPRVHVTSKGGEGAVVTRTPTRGMSTNSGKVLANSGKRKLRGLSPSWWTFPEFALPSAVGELSVVTRSRTRGMYTNSGNVHELGESLGELGESLGELGESLGELGESPHHHDFPRVHVTQNLMNSSIPQ